MSETPRVGHSALLALVQWLQQRRHASNLDPSAADLAELGSGSPPQAGGADRPASLAPAGARTRRRR
ncbi:MAG: hypothetical protein ACJ8H8_20510 [Geminicoccaceae bacterium]